MMLATVGNGCETRARSEAPPGEVPRGPLEKRGSDEVAQNSQDASARGPSAARFNGCRHCRRPRKPSRCGGGSWNVCRRATHEHSRGIYVSQNPNLKQTQLKPRPLLVWSLVVDFILLAGLLSSVRFSRRNPGFFFGRLVRGFVARL